MEKFIPIIEYILYFFFYSAFGWTLEVGYCYIKKKRFINRGFLHGPLCPIYGVGALSMLLTLSWCKNLGWAGPVVAFFLGILVCDIVEYLTSYIMEKLFDKRWWNYSKKKYNLHGRICLEHSCYWGVGSVLMVYVLHPLGAENLSELISDKVKVILFAIIMIIFIVDLIATVIKTLKAKKEKQKLEK